MSWTTHTDPSGWQTRWSDEFATKWRAEGHWTEPTLRDFARTRCAEDPDKAMLIEGDNRLTRGACRDQALRLAAWFIERGLKPGDVISFQLPNWNEVSVIALAARMCALVINPIPPIYRESELAYILADCGSKLIFVPGMFRKCDHTAMIEGLRSQLPLLKDVVVVRNDGSLRFEQIVTGAPAAESDLPEIDPASVIIAMYTSGTTGRPKCVLHTHYTYGHRVNAMAVAYGMTEADVTFMPSPVTHITGAIWAFDMPWVAGNTSVLMDVWSPEEGIACIEQNACTVSGGATPFLQQMLDIAEVAPERLRSMRLFFCGGTTVSPELINRAAAMVPQALFYRAYGSTECLTATLGHSERKDAWLGAETDGRIVYPVEMRIVDAANMAELSEGEEGEIYLRAPGLFVGYLDPADNEGNFEPDGFFKMGDLGRRVHCDYLVITGRSKDIIIRSGENISPKEVEDALYGHPAVAEVAIVAMPSKKTGEMGCAFIIPCPGQTIDLPDVVKFLDQVGLARQKFPEHLVLVDDLPRVPSGKVRKDVLRAQAKEIVEGN
ncbi:MAG: AMP-binding protein [Novosphingobium sp.]